MDIVEANRQYTKQLQLVVIPPVVDAFVRIWQEAQKAGQRLALKTFQAYLQDVKTWNDTMIRNHTDVVMRNCEYFTDLLAAVFLSNVKILSSLKARKNPDKVNLKVPANDVFVHTTMTNLARILYKSPFVMQIRNEDERDDELIKRVDKAIEQTIFQLTPYKDVLRANIGTDMMDDVGESNNPDETIEDTNAFTDQPAEAPRVPEAEPNDDGPEAQEEEGSEEPPEEEEEVKTIGDVDDDNLFPDAKEDEKYVP